MGQHRVQHVTIIGVGLLGGSAALGLKAHDPDVRIAGVGRRQSSLDQALAVGAIDTAHLDPLEPVRSTDMVILATPVRAFAGHLRAIAGVLPDGAIVTDVGSTKTTVVRTAERILGPGRAFVGSHPMAGSEQKGVTFSRADLFAGATCIVTPTRRTPLTLVRRVERMWRRLGMRIVRMSPMAHDRAVARVSHLPHVLASLLMLLPGEADLAVAASGFRDATRLASGDPEMWRDILTTNHKAVLAAMDELQRDMGQLRAMVEARDAEGIEALLARAKRRRDETIAQVIHDRRIAAE